MFNSQVTPYADYTGPYAYVAGGAALRNQGYGFINLTWPGGTSKLVAAYLIWSILNNTVPPSTATLNGVNITGTWTAYATPSPCWSPTYIYTFVADVSSVVVNGSNNLTNVPSAVTSGANPWAAGPIGPVDDSASLVVIYDNTSSSTIHQVTVYSGASPVGGTAPGYEYAQLNYTPTISIHATTTYMIADGQLPGNVAYWNGSIISNNAFPGSDPKETTTAFSYGNLSDTRTWNVNVTVGSNNTTAEIVSGGGDCFTWVGQVVSVEVPATKGPYNVTFAEQGLPDGNSWNVTTHSTLHSSTVVNNASSIVFSLRNGTYSYQVDSIPGFIAAPSTGNVSVSGGPVYVRVIFHALLYVITFNETGLPGLVYWWTQVSNASQSLSTNLTNYAPLGIQFEVANGTYDFVSGMTGLYRSMPGSGSFTVDGSNVVENITFVPPWLYNVTFVEENLTAGTTWGGYSDTNWIAVSNYTATTSFVLRLPNASLDTDYFSPYPVTGYQTPYDIYYGVHGANMTIYVNYSRLYTVQLAETGLAGETFWSAYLTGAPTSYASSYGPDLNFSAPNGTYPWSVNPVWNYTATPVSGSITVAGANVSISVVFSAAVLYTITISETGLAPGATWSATLVLPTGKVPTVNSTGTELSFLEPNGTYPFTVDARGYTASPDYGYLYITGANASESIVFTQVWLIAFTENGLPSDTYWYIDLNDVYVTSYSTTIDTWVANGSYSWISFVEGSFTPTPGEGSLDVLGSNVAQTVNFSSPTEPTYTLTFTESGLAASTNWSVALNGYAETSTTDAIVFTEPNGTWEFEVNSADSLTPSPAAGDLTVSGANVSQAVSFGHSTAPTSFEVTFTESGLPDGGTWYINITGQTGLEATVSGSGGTTLEISLTNATYDYTAASNEVGWTTPTPGPFQVAGLPLDVAVPFTSPSTPQYLVTFTESGLPSGATWFVNISGEPGQSATISGSSGVSLSLALPNATYPFTAATSEKGWTTSASGSFTVAGMPVNEPVPFTATSVKEYTVTFTESGLPHGATWYVNVTGETGLSATVSSSGGTQVTITLVPGSYNYAVATNWKNWTTTTPGSFDLTDANQGVTVAFTEIPVHGPGTTSTGSSFPFLWLGIGILIAALLLLFFLIYYRRRKKENPPPPSNTSTTGPPGGSQT